MTLDTVITKIQDAFGSKILAIDKKSDKRLYVDVDPKDIVGVVRFLFKDLGLRFNIASGVDDLEALEILYHFACDASNCIVTVRVALKDTENAHIDTITTVTKAAWWIEREIHELFGIVFDGSQDMRPLLLPDDWPKGVYPLRKNFIAPKRDSRKA